MKTEPEKPDHSLHTIRTPKWFHCQRSLNRVRGVMAPIGPKEITWAEFSFKSHLIPKSKKVSIRGEGYRITMAAVVYRGQIYFGASACAPEDLYRFNPDVAACRALGRARQFAFHSLAGMDLKGIGSFVVEVPAIPDTYDIKSSVERISEGLIPAIAWHVELESVREAVRRLVKHYRGRYTIQVSQ